MPASARICRKTSCVPVELHVAIIGAGATGTELAAELHRTTREVVAYGLDRIDPDRDIRILLIEAAGRILPGLPKRISEATHRLLEKMDIEVRTGARVAEVTADGVQLADDSFLRSELVVWTAGVKTPEVLRDLDGLEVNRINQLVVEPTLQPRSDRHIFAIGDCASCPRPQLGSPRRCRRGTGGAPGGLAYGATNRAHATRRATAAGTLTETSALWFHSANTARLGILWTSCSTAASSSKGCLLS